MLDEASDGVFARSRCSTEANEMFSCWSNLLYCCKNDDLRSPIEELAECDDLEHLNALLWEVTVIAGFKNFSLSLVRPGLGRFFPIRLLTSMKQEWLRTYLDDSLDQCDPFNCHGRASVATKTFSELRESGFGSNRYWRQLDHSGQGAEGICFVNEQGDGTRIVVTFSTTCSEGRLQSLLAKSGDDLEFVAQQASDSFCFSFHGPPIPDNALTRHETAFLAGLAGGMTLEAASLYSNPFGSNRTLQNSIRTKLGVRSVFQAVAIAAAKGWLADATLESGQVLHAHPVLVS